jgi:hypothetical protein
MANKCLSREASGNGHLALAKACMPGNYQHNEPGSRILKAKDF